MKGYVLLDDLVANCLPSHIDCSELVHYFWRNAPGYRIPAVSEAVAFLASKNRDTVDDLDVTMEKLKEVKK